VEVIVKRTQALLLVVGVCAVLAPLTARTDGCFMPTDAAWRRQRERSLILEPDQKALIYFSGGREQLIISPNYSGDASDFAWVVPVPSRPKVEILRGAPFHELARLVEPAPPVLAERMAGAAKSARPSSGVVVIERKTVGDYDVSVLSATDGRALIRWLDENHYHLPPKAEAPMKAYIAEGWTFVASKIRLHDSAGGLKSGTLTPLKLTFDTPHPIYPMRLTSASAQPFTVLIYIAEPATRFTGPLVPISRPDQDRGRSSGPYPSKRLPAEERYSFPTLARLSEGPLQVTWLRERLRPDQCDRDFVWEHRARPIIR